MKTLCNVKLFFSSLNIDVQIHLDLDKSVEEQLFSYYSDDLEGFEYEIADTCEEEESSDYSYELRSEAFARGGMQAVNDMYCAHDCDEEDSWESFR
jgi:hypothetical protein